MEFFFSFFLVTKGARGSVVVDALRYKPEQLGFETL
jgi:hypothetical protein